VDAGQQGAVPPALHRTIVCVDIEGFSRRINPDQIELRAALYAVLQQAFTETGIPWNGGGSYQEDRGDGVFILIPPTAPKSVLASVFPRELVTALRRHNRVATPETRMRLRVALHAGEVHFDDHGAVAAALNFTCRMLDAEALKAALRDSSGMLALITSEWFLEEVIGHDRACAALYRRVRVAVKETLTAPMTTWTPARRRQAASSMSAATTTRCTR
jgi:hypothetical protein